MGVLKDLLRVPFCGSHNYVVGCLHGGNGLLHRRLVAKDLHGGLRKNVSNEHVDVAHVLLGNASFV